MRSVPGIVAEVPPVVDEARRGWRSGQNLSALQAETNFGHRKRGCEATSSPLLCPIRNPAIDKALKHMVSRLFSLF